MVINGPKLDCKVLGILTCPVAIFNVSLNHYCYCNVRCIYFLVYRRTTVLICWSLAKPSTCKISLLSWLITQHSRGCFLALKFTIVICRTGCLMPLLHDWTLSLIPPADTTQPHKLNCMLLLFFTTFVPFLSITFRWLVSWYLRKDVALMYIV